MWRQEDALSSSSGTIQARYRPGGTWERVGPLVLAPFDHAKCELEGTCAHTAVTCPSSASSPLATDVSYLQTVGTRVDSTVTLVTPEQIPRASTTCTLYSPADRCVARRESALCRIGSEDACPDQ